MMAALTCIDANATIDAVSATLDLGVRVVTAMIEYDTRALKQISGVINFVNNENLLWLSRASCFSGVTGNIVTNYHALIIDTSPYAMEELAFEIIMRDGVAYSDLRCEIKYENSLGDEFTIQTQFRELSGDNELRYKVFHENSSKNQSKMELVYHAVIDSGSKWWHNFDQSDLNGINSRSTFSCDLAETSIDKCNALSNLKIG